MVVYVFIDIKISESCRIQRHLRNTVIGYQVSTMKNWDEVGGTKYIVQGNDTGYLTAIVGIYGTLYSPHTSVAIGFVTNGYEVIYKSTKVGDVRVKKGEEQAKTCNGQSSESMLGVVEFKKDCVVPAAPASP